MLVAEKEHDRARVIQLVHGVEVGDFCQVHKVNDRKVLQLICSCGQNLQAAVKCHGNKKVFFELSVACSCSVSMKCSVLPHPSAYMSDPNHDQSG